MVKNVCLFNFVFRIGDRIAYERHLLTEQSVGVRIPSPPSTAASSSSGFSSKESSRECTAKECSPKVRSPRRRPPRYSLEDSHTEFLDEMLHGHFSEDDSSSQSDSSPALTRVSDGVATEDVSAPLHPATRLTPPHLAVQPRQATPLLSHVSQVTNASLRNTLHFAHVSILTFYYHSITVFSQKHKKQVSR